MSRTPAHLTGLEAALGGLTPSATRFNRDRLLYEAGRRAGRGGLSWPIAAVAFAGLSATLGVMLALRPEPPERVAEATPSATVPLSTVETPASAPTESTPDLQWGHAFRESAGYLSRRDQVVWFGADALPASPAAPGATREPDDEWKQLHGSH